MQYCNCKGRKGDENKKKNSSDIFCDFFQIRITSSFLCPSINLFNCIEIILH